MLFYILYDTLNFTCPMHFSTLFNQKVDPPRVELGSQEPESHMLPLHHGSLYNKRRGKCEINK